MVADAKSNQTLKNDQNLNRLGYGFSSKGHNMSEGIWLRMNEPIFETGFLFLIMKNDPTNKITLLYQEI